MNKGLRGRMMVLAHVQFAIEMMDKKSVQDLDMLSICDQDGLSLLVFAEAKRTAQLEFVYRFALAVLEYWFLKELR